MSTITATSQATALANSIIKNFDSNSDGSLSAEEFTTFLTQLVGNVKAPRTPAAAASTTARGAAAASTEAAVATSSTAAQTTLYPSASSTAASRSRVGEMLGFSADKIRDESHVTFKYQVGRILQFCPNTPEGLQQALPEIQKLVPGAKIIGTHGDKIDFGDYEDPRAGRIGVIDVLVGAASGGRGWAWQPVES